MPVCAISSQGVVTPGRRLTMTTSRGATLESFEAITLADNFGKIHLRLLLRMARTSFAGMITLKAPVVACPCIKLLESFGNVTTQALCGPELDNNVACSADACRFKSRLEISPLSIWGRLLEICLGKPVDQDAEFVSTIP